MDGAHRSRARRWAAAAAAAGMLFFVAACGGTSGAGGAAGGSAGGTAGRSTGGTAGGAAGGAPHPAKAPAAAPQPATTRVTAFTPEGFTATATVDGHCWTGSVAAPRAGAYRCTAGNAIHDPCFTGLAPGEVACPTGDPAAQRGTVIRLTKALPKVPAGRPNPAHPWYFRLADGGVCGAMTGTVMPGHPYGCNDPQVYCAPPTRQAGSLYTVSCAPISKQRAADGAPQLGTAKTYRVAAMWL